MTLDSLWGEEFSVQEEEKLQKVLNKVKKPKKVTVVSDDKKLKSKKTSIDEKIEIIKEQVYKILGKYKNNTRVIRDYNEFKEYIDSSILNGELAVDTETNNSLNTFDCKLMGLCLYTPGKKNAYIPVNHVNRETGEKLLNQITEKQINEQLSRLNNTNLIFHNATFDIEVIKTTCDIKLKCYWDTLSGAQLLNENELKGLKNQYKLHIDPEQDKYDIEHLFNGLPYEIFDPELFALYAATDSYMTYRLYQYQKTEFEKPENKDVYNLLRTIEIPILDVIVDMELEGVAVDLEYATKMSKIYHERSDEIQAKIDTELERLKPIIDNWRQTEKANTPEKIRPSKPGSGLWVPDDKKFPFKDELGFYRLASKTPNQQLANPPELSSPTQMAIMLYDVLKVGVIDKKTPRGTGADILEALKDKVHLCELLLEKREIDILINTFIDAIPTYVEKDGRVHARFNSCGTQTGRFSSNKPNLQNIPSHSKDIRLIFKPREGYCIAGSDFSGQEMRILASLANDKQMINAYETNRDIYATVASLIYKNNYEDNLEFNPITGEKQPEGKNRRSSAKTVALGLNYGMSAKSLSERLGESLEEAQKVIDGYYGGLLGVKKYTEESQQMLKKYGYVTDAFGRRRHIPDGTLEEYEFKSNKPTELFNPFLNTPQKEDTKTKKLIESYKKKLSQTKWKRDKDLIIEQAKKDGFEIKNNSLFISRAMRQCLNARIQGSAGSMTKLAMIMIHNDKELNDLGFKLLITVHDEVLGEAPSENVNRAAERLCEVMVEAAKVKCASVPWKCDPYICADGWYEDELCAEILKEYGKCKNVDSIKEKYPFLNGDSIKLVCEEKYTIGKDSIKLGEGYYE